MNPFRPWLGQHPPADSPPTTVVPPGHELRAYAVPEQLDPSLRPIEGGVCVVFLGHGSDEPVEELEGLLRQLEPRMAAPQRPVLLAMEAGRISQLFAPSNPAIQSCPRFLLWVFTQAGLEDWLEKPARLQALLRHIHRLQHPTQPFTQCAYFEHDSGPGAAVMARLLAGLGLLVCVAEPGSNRLLAEVYRPEGTVITKLLGDVFPLDGGADTVLATLYKQQAQAEAQGNATRLRSLQQVERDHLCRELQTLQSEPHRMPPLRAPRLCRLLRTAVEQGGPTARRELERELLERARPLPLLMKPDGCSSFIARLPGIGPVLQVYPDLRSLQMAVKELGLAEGSYRPGGIPVRDFFAYGAQQNLPVALNLSMTPYTSTDVRWSPAEARLLAQGQSPTAVPRLSASPAGSGRTPEQFRGVLTEADGYLQQGLYNKALESLRRIFSHLPENLDAHEKAYHVFVAAGDTQQALEQCLNVLRLCTRHAEVQRARPYLTALLQQWPNHPEMPAFLAVLGQDEMPFQTEEKTVIGRKSMSLELTAEEQRAAHADDTMMQMLRLMNGNQPYPGFPEGAIPLSELESGACDGKMFRIKRALRVGVDPNEKTVLYGTALHAAAQAGQLDIARLLVDHGANPQLRDDKGRTPAELARLQKHGHVAAFLESIECH
jgi:tetratricopeptide (TPR) repeat protein